MVLFYRAGEKVSNEIWIICKFLKKLMQSGTNFGKSVLQCSYYFGGVCGCAAVSVEKGNETMKKHLKISVKRLCAVALAVLLTVSVLCVPALAQTEGTGLTLPGVPVTLTVPEGVKVITTETYYDDPVWAELDILDTYTKGNEMIENNVLAELYAFDNECVIAVTKKESEFSASLYNLNNMAEEDKEEFLRGLIPFTADGGTTGTSGWYEHEQVPFFRVDIESTALTDEMVYERLYGTMFNGIILTFDLYNGSEPISEEYDALMRQLVDSVVISEFTEKPVYEVSTAAKFAVAILAVLFGLLIFYIIYRSYAKKRDKAARKQMVDRLAEYRRAKENAPDAGDGDLRFLNETVHDNAAIRAFSKYQAMRGTNLFMSVFTVALALAALAIVMQFDMTGNWWMIVALIGFVAFSVYRSATAHVAIEKTLIRVYSKMRSRKAAFYFYDGDMRVTGLQASNLYPYFQITRMVETKDYFYLYFGEGTTYFVKKDGFKGFEKGKGADEFRAFMKEKLEGNGR